MGWGPSGDNSAKRCGEWGGDGEQSDGDGVGMERDGGGTCGKGWG